jgi:hypothetical protein
MDVTDALRRLSQQMPALPAHVADRITRALAAESVRRAAALSRGSAAPRAVPRQRSRARQPPATRLPRPSRADDRA